MSKPFNSSVTGCHHSEDCYEHPTPGLLYVETSFAGPGIDPDLLDYSCEGCLCDSLSSCLNCHSSSYDDGVLLKPNVLLGNSQPIFECNDSCECSLSCVNKVTQKGPIDCLEIVKFTGKNYGIVTKAPICKGTFVCEYAGEIISTTMAKERLQLLTYSDSNYILIMKEHFKSRMPQYTVIDPTIAGNIGRYINHSCNPNLRLVPVRNKGLQPIAALFTLQDVIAGEELCYDYGDNIDNTDFGTFKGCSGITLHSDNNSTNNGVKPCLCKSKNCRQFLPYDSNPF